MADRQDETRGGPEQTSAPASVLVVDDEGAVRHFLQVVLQRMGFQVSSAGGGAEALKLCEERDFDVVLTDLVMPRIDGIEVIRRVKERSPETEVVVITGYPSSETIVAALRAGALDYLPKSPDKEHLQVLVEKALEVRALRRKAGERDFFLRMAQMDGLTELFNRQTFLAFMEREFGRARRTGRAISLILAGIDGFGRLCRNEGQLFADNLVRRLGQAFKSNCRDYDIVARFGNEEFALLAPETPRQGAQILVQRLNDAVTRLPACGPEQVSCSFGLAAFPEDGSAPDELLECAARALRPALQPAS